VHKVNLKEKLSLFSDHWNPRIVGELNGQQVKLAKLQGEFIWHEHAFIWHEHAQEDELFLVLKGRLTVKLRDRDVELEPGEFFIVPRGVEHQPVAAQEVHVLMFEPTSTLNTGVVRNELTRDNLETL
jgi:mannose-6-phosphate isomerase-like protein (cupin superfamily)